MTFVPPLGRPTSSFPDITSTRQYIGAWSVISVLQYFAAEGAAIAAWAGNRPYDLRTGYISDLGALSCGVFDGRDVCSPLNWLMNASFVVQGLGMLSGAALLGSGLLCVAAAAGIKVKQSPGKPWLAAVAVRLLTGLAGIGTVIVGLVPEDAGSGWHLAGALMYFASGSSALLVLGVLWLRKAALAWFILACGGVSFSALVVGGLTGMQVPEPGTLERLMAYPITVGMAAAGMVIAYRVHRHRKQSRAAARLSRAL